MSILQGGGGGNAQKYSPLKVVRIIYFNISEENSQKMKPGNVYFVMSLKLFVTSHLIDRLKLKPHL